MYLLTLGHRAILSGALPSCSEGKAEAWGGLQDATSICWTKNTLYPPSLPQKSPSTSSCPKTRSSLPEVSVSLGLWRKQ